jgi:glycerol uptake facilitator-like aquaporin
MARTSSDKTPGESDQSTAGWTHVAPLRVRLFAEGLGTALLVAAVVGSGIMAQNLSPHDAGLELLENAIATGAVLFVLIATLGPVSGAQLNPVVTLVDAWFGGLGRRDVAPYIVVQVLGACAGAILANLMFGLTAVSISTHDRSGSGVLLSEIVATFGLLLLILGLVRGGRSEWIAPAVASYIVGAYWFTASTSFANPAVTVGRTLSNTFAGIAPASVPAFIVAQLVGGVLAVGATIVLWPRHSTTRPVAMDVVEETR